MKKIIFIFIVFIISYQIYPLKFTVDPSSDRKIVIKTFFEFGASLSGANDLYGVTEYQSLFFKTSFHIADFGIGLDFKWRFKLFNQRQEFYEKDWYVEGDAVKTVLNYLDKIDFIKYGEPGFPFYFTTGKIPYLTWGTGFVVKDYHNNFFFPVSRENGLYFKFDGSNLSKYNWKEIPISASFFCTDLLDPDIFGFNVGVDIFKFTKIPPEFNLKAEFITMLDLNATESNRLSALSVDTIDKGNQRNMFTVGYTTGLAIFSFPITFTWKHKYFRLSSFNEAGLLSDFTENNNRKLGFGDKIGSEVRFIDIKDSGFLVGINAGFMFQTANFKIDYFSSNYEVIRKKQFYNLPSQFDTYVFAGLSIYAMDDVIQFHINTAIPFSPMANNEFYAKFSSKFVMEKLPLKTTKPFPDLYIAVFYETDVNQIRIGTYVDTYKSDGTHVKGLTGGSNGGYFINSITDGFRFSFEFGFKFYSAKIGFLVGIQRPSSVSLSIQSDDPDNAYYKVINLDQYNNDLQKFISLEASFVL